MQEAGRPLTDVTNQVPKKRGRKSLVNLTPEEKKSHKVQLQRERREKKRKAKEEYLQTPEGQAADR